KEATLQYVGGLTVLLILIAIFPYLQPQFHTWTNFLNILETNATLLILSVGLTFVLLVGGFDLSIGGVLALAGVCVAKLLEQGVGTYGSMIIVVLGGVALRVGFKRYSIAEVGPDLFLFNPRGSVPAPRAPPP